jgi:hypothetical protein
MKLPRVIEVPNSGKLRIDLPKEKALIYHNGTLVKP